MGAKDLYEGRKKPTAPGTGTLSGTANRRVSRERWGKLPPGTGSLPVCSAVPAPTQGCKGRSPLHKRTKKLPLPQRGRGSGGWGQQIRARAGKSRHRRGSDTPRQSKVSKVTRATPGTKLPPGAASHQNYSSRTPAASQTATVSASHSEDCTSPMWAQPIMSIHSRDCPMPPPMVSGSSSRSSI